MRLARSAIVAIALNAIGLPSAAEDSVAAQCRWFQGGQHHASYALNEQEGVEYRIESRNLDVKVGGYGRRQTAWLSCPSCAPPANTIAFIWLGRPRNDTRAMSLEESRQAHRDLFAFQHGFLLRDSHVEVVTPPTSFGFESFRGTITRFEFHTDQIATRDHVVIEAEDGCARLSMLISVHAPRREGHADIQPLLDALVISRVPRDVPESAKQALWPKEPLPRCADLGADLLIPPGARTPAPGASQERTVVLRPACAR